MRFSRIQNLRLGLAAALSAAATLVASPASAQAPGDSAAPYVAPVPVDSALPAWMPDPAGIFLGQRRSKHPPIRLTVPRFGRDRIGLHWTDLSGNWWRGLESSLAADRDTMWLGAHGVLAVAGERRARVLIASDTVAYLPINEEPVDTVPTLESFLPGRVGQYADLSMLITGRGEMGGAWQRFEPCDANGISTCDQGIIPRMRPDLQFGVLLGGTITDRVHVAVDYDQAREFDA